jgi:hypothetical protein
VAVDARSNQVYVPIRGNQGQAPGPTGSTCSKGMDVFGLAGSDALGCIAIYAAPSDQDDKAVRTHRAGRRDDLD